MLILVDVATKARIQVGVFVAEVLTKHLRKDKAVALATALTEGRWTHDFPITVELARQLGFPVSTNMPRTVYDLMDLYPTVSVVTLSSSAWSRPPSWRVRSIPKEASAAQPAGPNHPPNGMKLLRGRNNV